MRAPNETDFTGRRAHRIHIPPLYDDRVASMRVMSLRLHSAHTPTLRSCVPSSLLSSPTSSRAPPLTMSFPRSRLLLPVLSRRPPLTVVMGRIPQYHPGSLESSSPLPPPRMDRIHSLSADRTRRPMDPLLPISIGMPSLSTLITGIDSRH
jgi:hypothetical protein